MLASLRGHTHVVTTSALATCARGVLGSRALLPFFADVLGREHGIWPGEGKDCGIVGERSGIPEGELARRLVIVGDGDRRDADVRGRPIVPVHDERMGEQPSEPLEAALRALAAEGDGDWAAGFERLREREVASGRFMPQLVLDGGVQFGIDHWGDYAGGRAHRAISRPRRVTPA